MKKRILVLDTNVLLNEPQALFKYPNATIIIPQVVLKELDKIKITKADKTLQYNGRVISRYLFTLSESGNLTEGIELENGSLIKVSNLEEKDKQNLPPNLKTKFNDDKILALAYTLKKKDEQNEVVLVTNDLNMLIKAQAQGIKTKHHSGLSKTSKLKRFFNNQIATLKRNPVMAMFFALTLGGIVAIIVLLSSFLGSYITNQTNGPPKLVAQNQLFQAKEKQYKNLLDKNSADQKALFGLTDLYIEMGHYFEDSQYYSKALDLLENTTDNNKSNKRIEATIIRLHFYLKMDDVAYSELKKIVRRRSQSTFAALLEQAQKTFKYKEHSTSIIFLKQALIVKPDDIETRLDLAEAYYQNKQTEETIKELHQALSINDKYAIIYYNLGYVYWKSKADATTSISYFEKYLELEPNGSLAKQAKANIEQIKKS